MNIRRKDKRPDTSYKYCTHCQLMLGERNFRRAKTDVCKECEDAPGFFYIAHNPAWPKVYKIGITENPPRRLNEYNSSIPFGDTEFVYVKGTAYYEQIEKEMLVKFSSNRIRKTARCEWLSGINDVGELIESIEYFHHELKALKELDINLD